MVGGSTSADSVLNWMPLLISMCSCQTWCRKCGTRLPNVVCTDTARFRTHIHKYILHTRSSPRIRVCASLWFDLILPRDSYLSTIIVNTSTSRSALTYLSDILFNASVLILSCCNLTSKEPMNSSSLVDLLNTQPMENACFNVCQPWFGR